MGSGSCYSVLEDDKVYLVGLDDDLALNSSRESNDRAPQSNTVGRSTEFTIDLQVPFSLLQTDASFLLHSLWKLVQHFI